MGGVGKHVEDCKGHYLEAWNELALDQSQPETEQR